MKKTYTIILVGMAVAMTACSDNATAPAVAAPESSKLVYGGGATQALAPGEMVKFNITINPQQNTYYYLGDGNSLTFPAGSLCDPNKSSYGTGEWDKPCTAAYWPVTVSVTAWMDASGHARVDFDKHLRFVPSSNPSKWVVITFGDLQASRDPFFNILYCPSENSQCKDESLTDASLITQRNPSTGKITRRIKHFSGYNVAAGRSNMGGDYSVSFSVSPDDRKFTDVPDVLKAYPSMSVEQAEQMLQIIRSQKKSGYILASG